MPALDELVKPHIESFNALVEQDDGGKGILQVEAEDLGEKVVFDGKEVEGMPRGSKISCEPCFFLCFSFVLALTNPFRSGGRARRCKDCG